MKTNKYAFFIFSLLLTLFACNKTQDITFGSADIHKIALSRGALDMMEGDTVNLDVIFNSKQTKAKFTDLNWTIENPKIAILQSSKGVQTPVLALSEGRTVVHVESPDKMLSASKEINVVKSTILLNSIYLDFGTGFFGKPFNSITNFRNHKVINLHDILDNETGVDFEIVDDFEGENRSGVINNMLGLPPSVSEDAFWGSGGNARAEVKLSRLNRNKYYDINFYGSRRDVGDNRETSYTVTGRYQPTTVYQNSSNNASQISSVKKVRPNQNGEIIVTITPGPNNNNGSKFFYLNVMTIDPSAN